MKTYPIAIELTAWVELGIHQYNISIDDKSTVSIKRSDDVLHTRELNTMEVSNLIEAISRVEIPLLEYVSTDSTIASSSYELIIESAHFSNEFNFLKKLYKSKGTPLGHMKKTSTCLRYLLIKFIP